MGRLGNQASGWSQFLEKHRLLAMDGVRPEKPRGIFGENPPGPVKMFVFYRPGARLWRGGKQGGGGGGGNHRGGFPYRGGLRGPFSAERTDRKIVCFDSARLWTQRGHGFLRADRFSFRDGRRLKRKNLFGRGVTGEIFGRAQFSGGRGGGVVLEIRSPQHRWFREGERTVFGPGGPGKKNKKKKPRPL